jgi:hypothetical protein
MILDINQRASADSAIAQEDNFSHSTPPSLTSSDRTDAWKIENALSAGPKFITDHATVMDRPLAQNKELKIGDYRNMKTIAAIPAKPFVIGLLLD